MPSDPENHYPMTIFHDGNCPICRFDMDNLKARNHEEKLAFIDVAAPEFDPTAYGMSQTDFITEIHAQCADGRFVKGMEVFRLAYRAVGLGWAVAPASWGPLRQPANALYRLFARNRGKIGKHFGWIFESLAACQARKRATQCNNGSCTLPPLKSNSKTKP